MEEFEMDHSHELLIEPYDNAANQVSPFDKIR